MSTSVQTIRWARTSIGDAGSSSGQNAGNSPQMTCAPTPSATPRRSCSDDDVTTPSDHRLSPGYTLPRL